MKRSRALLAFLVAACSGGQQGEVRFDELSPEVKRAFDGWKNQLLKRCRISDAFPSLMPDSGEKPGEPPYESRLFVDARRLFDATEGHALFSDSDGTVLALGSPESLSGIWPQEYSRSWGVNGRTGRLELRSMLEGSDCVVTFNNEEVYRSNLYQKMPVAWAVSADQAHGLAPRPIEYTYRRDGVSVAGLAQVVGPLQSMMTATTQAPAVATSMARRLALTEAEAAEYFPFKPQLSPVALEANLAGTPAFLPDVDGARLYGPPEGLDPVFATAATPGELEVSWLLAPQINLAPGSVETADRLWRIQVRVQLQEKQETTSDHWKASLSVSRISLVDTLPKSDADAQGCFQKRAAFLGQSAPNQIPLATDVGLPCKGLATSFVGALAKSSESKLVVLGFAMQEPSSFSARRDYRGWDVLFADVAIALARSPDELADLLVPHGAGPKPATDALARLNAMRAPLDSAASQQDLYLAPLVRVALSWMFKAAVVSESLPQSVAATFRNAGEAYPESVARMLADLETLHVEPLPGPAAAECGAQLAGERASATRALLAKLRPAGGARDWVASAESSILQRCWNQDQLASLSQTADLALAFIDEENPLGADQLGFGDALASLVTRALDESWTSASFWAFRRIADYAAVSAKYPLCRRSARSSISACTGLEPFTIDPPGLLSADVAQRYGDLADELRSVEVEWLRDAEFFLAHVIDSAFFDPVTPLWRSCTADQFSLQRRRLLQRLQDHRSAADFDSRYDIKTTIEGLLQSCD